MQYSESKDCRRKVPKKQIGIPPTSNFCRANKKSMHEAATEKGLQRLVHSKKERVFLKNRQYKGSRWHCSGRSVGKHHLLSGNGSDNNPILLPALANQPHPGKTASHDRLQNYLHRNNKEPSRAGAIPRLGSKKYKTKAVHTTRPIARIWRFLTANPSAKSLNCSSFFRRLIQHQNSFQLQGNFLLAILGGFSRCPLKPSG